MSKKPKIAIVSLTCCEGCQMAALDLGERFLDLAGEMDIAEFHFLEELAEPEFFDVAFIEGSPISKENQERLLILRKKSKFVVALGACACLGGVQEIKNYQDKNKVLRYVYKNIECINNPDIKPLKAYVQVDLEIPGCPMTKEEFLSICQKILAGYPIEHIKIPQRPVCYDCQLKRNECLLQKDLPCLGPIILGGCGAPCPTSKYPCDGCRGPLRGVNPNNLNKLLGENYDPADIDMIMQRFGALDDIYAAHVAIPPGNLPVIKNDKQ